MKTILVTGCAGFIGHRVSQMLLEQFWNVVGIDNLNDYYDIGLKYWRLQQLQQHSGFTFYGEDIENLPALRHIAARHRIDALINLAARAGIRYSMENPHIYMSTNAGGTLNLLELCRQFEIPKFVLASTSSVYAGQPLPFTEDMPVNTPISPYAASKKAAEVTAYTYHYLYGLDVSVLRYFTVYGPAGRPDMAMLPFICSIMAGRPITVFGNGRQSRDFTYIDDIARGTIQALQPLGYEIINLGNHHPEPLLRVIELIEAYTGHSARIISKPAHQADMQDTWASIERAHQFLNWQPHVSLDEGIRRTVEWCREQQALLAALNWAGTW